MDGAKKNEGIKIKLVKSLTKFLLSKGMGNVISHSPLRSSMYKIADYILKDAYPENEVFEVQGFKIKRGTTRKLLLAGDIYPSMTALIKKEVKKGMYVFDLGANIGWFTLLFSKLVGEIGHVCAFEANPDTFKILKENIEINKIKNVSIFQLAISNKIGVARFNLDRFEDGESRLESKMKTQNPISVKTTTLDQFCAEHNMKVDFIKMHIEGSEPKAFQGMKNTISSNPKIKIISKFHPLKIIDVDSSPKDYLNSLEESRFIVNEIDENSMGEFRLAQKEKLLKNRKRIVDLYCFMP